MFASDTCSHWPIWTVAHRCTTTLWRKCWLCPVGKRKFYRLRKSGKAQSTIEERISSSGTWTFKIQLAQPVDMHCRIRGKRANLRSQVLGLNQCEGKNIWREKFDSEENNVRKHYFFYKVKKIRLGPCPTDWQFTWKNVDTCQKFIS